MQPHKPSGPSESDHRSASALPSVQSSEMKAQGLRVGGGLDWLVSILTHSREDVSLSSWWGPNRNQESWLFCVTSKTENSPPQHGLSWFWCAFWFPNWWQRFAHFQVTLTWLGLLALPHSSYATGAINICLSILICKTGVLISAWGNGGGRGMSM